MAWTKEQAEIIVREQKARLEAQGRLDVVMIPKFSPDEGGYIVEGFFTSDLASDPIWGPIARELGLLEEPGASARQS